MRMQRRGPFLLQYAVNQQLHSLLANAMADAPLRPGDFAVYSALRLEQPTTPSALAAVLGLRLTTMSSQLARMAALGHLARDPNPRDGRSTLISLTLEGVAATEACFASFQAAIKTFRRHLTCDEADLLDRLDDMGTALERSLEEAPGKPATSPRGRPRSARQ
jgi:DNA-binding MarR family transcriptional regulator